MKNAMHNTTHFFRGFSFLSFLLFCICICRLKGVKYNNNNKYLLVVIPVVGIAAASQFWAYFHMLFK